MTWKLIEANDIDATLDDSGVYVVINRIKPPEPFGRYTGGPITEQPIKLVQVRADLMTATDEPIVSFFGTANNVRKHLIRFITKQLGIDVSFSHEHASYIGYELLRAERTVNYVQD